MEDGPYGGLLPLAPPGGGLARDPRDPRAGEAIRRAAGPGELEPGCLALLGVPFDWAVPGRPGARFGPSAIRDELARATVWHPGLGLDLRRGPALCDLGDVAVAPGDVVETQRRVARVVQAVAAAGAVPVVLGGDHSVTVGTVRGLAGAWGPLGLVHFDAHHDAREPVAGFCSSGTVLRLLLEDGRRPLCGRRTVQIGIAPWRNSPHYSAYLAAHGVLSLEAAEVRRLGMEAVVARAARATAGGPFAISFDLDVLAAAYAPGVSAPVTAGLDPGEAAAAVQLLAQLPGCVGMDIVECSPPLDRDGFTARAAAELVLALWAGKALAARAGQEETCRRGE